MLFSVSEIMDKVSLLFWMSSARGVEYETLSGRGFSVSHGRKTFDSLACKLKTSSLTVSVLSLFSPILDNTSDSLQFPVIIFSPIPVIIFPPKFYFLNTGSGGRSRI
jgi:hypothetical protein